MRAGCSKPGRSSDKQERNRVGGMRAVKGSPVFSSMSCSPVAVECCADEHLAVHFLDGLSFALPTAVTASTAFTAASMVPVWPTISGFAKVHDDHIVFSTGVASTSLSQILVALISGFRS